MVNPHFKIPLQVNYGRLLRHRYEIGGFASPFTHSLGTFKKMGAIMSIKRFFLAESNIFMMLRR